MIKKKKKSNSNLHLVGQFWQKIRDQNDNCGYYLRVWNIKGTYQPPKPILEAHVA